MGDFTLLEVYAVLLAVGLVAMFLVLAVIAKNVVSVNKKLTEIAKLQSVTKTQEAPYAVSNSQPYPQEAYPTYGNGNYQQRNQ